MNVSYVDVGKRLNNLLSILDKRVFFSSLTGKTLVHSITVRIRSEEQPLKKLSNCNVLGVYPLWIYSFFRNVNTFLVIQETLKLYSDETGRNIVICQYKHKTKTPWITKIKPLY